MCDSAASETYYMYQSLPLRCGLSCLVSRPFTVPKLSVSIPLYIYSYMFQVGDVHNDLFSTYVVQKSFAEWLISEKIEQVRSEILVQILVYLNNMNQNLIYSATFCFELQYQISFNSMGRVVLLKVFYNFTYRIARLLRIEAACRKHSTTQT